MYVRILVAGDVHTVQRAFGIQRLPRKPIRWKLSTRHTLNDLSDSLGFVASNPRSMAEFSGLIGFKIGQEAGCDANEFQCL